MYDYSRIYLYKYVFCIVVVELYRHYRWPDLSILYHLDHSESSLNVASSNAKHCSHTQTARVTFINNSAPCVCDLSGVYI